MPRKKVAKKKDVSGEAEAVFPLRPLEFPRLPSDLNLRIDYNRKYNQSVYGQFCKVLKRFRDIPQREAHTDFGRYRDNLKTARRDRNQQGYFSDKEWNFDKLPPGELLPCLYYEYGREATWFHDDLKSAEPAALKRREIIPHAVKMVLCGMEHHDFPSVPWQRLPESVRRQAAEMFKLSDHTLQPDLGFGDATENFIRAELSGGPMVSSALRECSRAYPGPRRKGDQDDGYDFRIFRFNHNLSPKLLGRLFEQWCRNNRPDEFKGREDNQDERRRKLRAPNFGKLRYGALASLRYLGVWRRLKCCTDKNRLKQFLGTWPHEWPVQDRPKAELADLKSDISNIEKKANKIILALYPRSATCTS
jgi:hypothetical protein